MKANSFKYLLWFLLLGLSVLNAKAGPEIMYWLDGNMSAMHTMPATSGLQSIDMANLAQGYHTLSIVAKDSNGNLSAPVCRTFLKGLSMYDNRTLKVKSSIDGSAFDIRDISPVGDVAEYSLDLTTLAEGVHQLTTEICRADGSMPVLFTNIFYRVASDAEKSAMRCLYIVDGQTENVQSGAFSNGVFHFDLDMENIATGLHSVDFMLVSDHGIVSQSKTAWFTKIPIGGNKIARYEYWLNDRFENPISKTLEQPSRDCNLIDLVEVENLPLRSSQFHFEFVDGKPTIFPANEFHVRFYDIANRITEQSGTYTDYRSPSLVEDVTTLTQPEASVRLGLIPENQIRWFKINMSIGDSLTLRSDKGVTIDMFDPLGQRIYSATGSAATTRSGTRTSAEGDFYIAVHDLSGHDAPTLTYQHIGKYAVLSHTPEKSAMAPGLFSVNLFGNGFDKLKSANLKLNDNVLTAESLVSQRYSNATLFFNIENSLPLGNYDLELCFDDSHEAEETLIVKNFLEFEQANYGEIKVSLVQANNSILPYSVKLIVENTGNVPYQLVPIHVGFDGLDKINGVQFKNFQLRYSKEAFEKGLDIGFEINDLFGSGNQGYYLPMMIMDLEAYQKVEYEFGFDTEYFTKFNLYAWAGEPWITKSQPRAERTVPERAVTQHTNNSLSDLANTLANISHANGVTFGSMILALDGLRNQAYKDAYPGVDLNDLPGPGGGGPQPVSPGNILLIAGGISDIPAVGGACQDDGASDPGANPYPVNVPGPHDPNEITGYKAQSGSRYIGIGVENLSYTIEFENEAGVAESAAHKISISNRLNPEIFDLSSVHTSTLSIGNKEVVIDKTGNFVTTVDLRPTINALAEVSLSIDKQTGELVYQFTSLDPLTVLPTFDNMQGILPVNNNYGSGEGYVVYDVTLRPGLQDNTDIPNSADITFDFANPIETPVWTNTTDYTRPVSNVVCARMKSENMALAKVEASDQSAGIWKYRLYCKSAADSELKLVTETENPDELLFPVTIGTDCELSVATIDKAGNEEIKALSTEYIFKPYVIGDANSDLRTDSQDATLITKYYVNQESVLLNLIASDINDDGIVDAQDNVGITRIYIGDGSNRVQMKQRIRR